MDKEQKDVYANEFENEIEKDVYEEDSDLGVFLGGLLFELENPDEELHEKLKELAKTNKQFELFYSLVRDYETVLLDYQKYGDYKTLLTNYQQSITELKKEMYLEDMNDEEFIEFLSTSLVHTVLETNEISSQGMMYAHQKLSDKIVYKEFDSLKIGLQLKDNDLYIHTNLILPINFSLELENDLELISEIVEINPEGNIYKITLPILDDQPLEYKLAMFR